MTEKRTCLIDGCGRVETLRRGMCDRCYRRVLRAGRLDQFPTIARAYRFKNAGGYVNVWEPTHPLAHQHGYVLEHRKVAWDAGILTDPALDVHHRNEIKDDNRIENLEVVTAAEHRSRHPLPERFQRRLTDDERREHEAARQKRGKARRKSAANVRCPVCGVLCDPKATACRAHYVLVRKTALASEEAGE